MWLDVQHRLPSVEPEGIRIPVPVFPILWEVRIEPRRNSHHVGPALDRRDPGIICCPCLFSGASLVWPCVPGNCIRILAWVFERMSFHSRLNVQVPWVLPMFLVNPAGPIDAQSGTKYNPPVARSTSVHWETKFVPSKVETNGFPSTLNCAGLFLYLLIQVETLSTGHIPQQAYRRRINQYNVPEALT